MKGVSIKDALLFAGFSLSLVAQSVSAQETVQSEKEEKDVEVILVSAQKREQALKEVPVSIEVIQGDLLERYNVQDGFDLIKYLPGFGIDDSTEIRTTTLKTRGIGTFTNSIGLQSSNLVVIDGEVLPRQSMLNLSVSDLQRVEALRGPQGTLFGQNTSTGLLHYVTKKPNLAEFGGKARLEITQDNGVEVSGHVNAPINDNWAMRVNAQYETIDGWIENTMPGAEDYDIGEVDAYGLRGQLLYDNGLDLEVLLRTEYSERETNCCAFTRIGGINPDFGPRPIINVRDDGTIEGTTYNRVNPESFFEEAGNPVTARNPEANYGETTNAGASIEVNYDISEDKTLSYIGSYRDFELFNSSGFFTVNFPVERSAFGGNESVEVIQQEIRLSSFGNEKLDWIVGLFFHDTKGQRSETRDGCIAGRRGLIENGVLAGCYSGPSTNAFLANYAETGIDDRSLLEPSRLLNGGDFTTQFTNYAIFGQLEYQITDELDATFGFRALKEEGEASFSRTDLRTPQDGVGLDTYEEVFVRALQDESLFINRTEPTKFSDSDTHVIYKAVLGYDFSDDFRGYVNYSTGYKGSSYFVTSNTNPDDVDNFPTKPEQSTNFEIGVRSSFLDNRLLFNLTYFDMRVEDYQVRAVRILDEDEGNTFAGYVNAEEARSHGFEADMILDITESLRFITSYANYEAVYEDFSNAPVNCPRSGTDRSGGNLADRCSEVAGAPRLDLSGLPFPNNAEEQFLGTLEQKYELGSWDGNVRIVYRYEGEATQTVNELAFDQRSNPSYGIWDAFVGIGKDNLRFNVFVRNVLDKEYTTRRNTNTEGFGSGFYPRDYSRFIGGSVTYTF
ncbi:TonB-dependent receptor [Alteromonas sp. KC3]|uniref:TonB-dependent receptor n=1 Tax=unclassified Alteromonas TaxID=2614992 RepID=UPI0019221736|nr:MULTISPECIES: TonB-dependent receptor [unclassified Alteromonas]BCO19679.1 TonB-dependent receptor [Alteromonas sp. KC3]BCO23644.1 TonB-dependent receptor [Alteromonas sp. KC14]